MRTVPFSIILNEAVQLCGLDRDLITPKTFRVMRDLSSIRLNEAWQREGWPFLNRYQNRTAGREISSFSTINGSSLVTFITPNQSWAYEDLFDTENPVLINVDTTLGANQAPMPRIQSSFAWTAYGGASITLDVGENQTATAAYQLNPSCGALWSVNDREFRIALPSNTDALLDVLSGDPRGSTRVIPVGYTIEELDNISFATLKQQQDVTIQFRIVCPRLTGNAYSSTTVYAVGDQAYGADGNFYDCLIANTGVPVTDSTTWSLVEIPDLFRSYLARAILSDYLRTESQFDQALAAEADAQAAYDRAVDVVLRQEQQISRVSMLHTY